MYVESAPASGLSCVRNCSHDPRETLELNMSTSTDPGGGTVLGVANRFEKIRESNLAPTSPDPRQGDRARGGPAWSVGPRCNLVRIHLPPEPDESRGWGPPQRVHSEGFFVGPPIKESPKGFPQVGARLENVHVVPVGPMKVPPKTGPKKKGSAAFEKVIGPEDIIPERYDDHTCAAWTASVWCNKNNTRARCGHHACAVPKWEPTMIFCGESGEVGQVRRVL